MSQAGNTQEIRSLTGLRGVAAIYVVIFHFLSGIALTNPLNIVLAHGYLAVDLFFVLSGFVMTLNYAGLFRAGGSLHAFRTFLGRRIARVYPLYLVATLCAAVLIASGWLDWLSGQPLGVAIPLNVAMIQAWDFGQSLDSPGWSISAEWAAYLLFPLALRLIYYGSLKRAVLAAIASVALILALCTLPPALIHRSGPQLLLDIADPHAAVPVLRCLPEFLLGILIARLHTQKQTMWLSAKRFVPESLCLAILLLVAQSGTDFLVVLLFPPLILSLTSQNSLPSQLLSGKLAHHFGELSYSIYLVHDLFGGLLARIHIAANLHGLHHGQSVGIAMILPLIYLMLSGRTTGLRSREESCCEICLKARHNKAPEILRRCEVKPWGLANSRCRT